MLFGGRCSCLLAASRERHPRVLEKKPVVGLGVSLPAEVVVLLVGGRLGRWPAAAGAETTAVAGGESAVEEDVDEADLRETKRFHRSFIAIFKGCCFLESIEPSGRDGLMLRESEDRKEGKQKSG